MTYNIHRAIGLDRRFRLDRVAQIVSHHDPDIVLLQEVDIGAPRCGASAGEDAVRDSWIDVKDREVAG